MTLMMTTIIKIVITHHPHHHPQIRIVEVEGISPRLVDPVTVEEVNGTIVVVAEVDRIRRRRPVGTGPDQGVHHIITIVIAADTGIDRIVLHVKEEDTVIMMKKGIEVDHIEIMALGMDRHLPCEVDPLHLHGGVGTATTHHHLRHLLTTTMVPIVV